MIFKLKIRQIILYFINTINFIFKKALMSYSVKRIEKRVGKKNRKGERDSRETSDSPETSISQVRLIDPALQKTSPEVGSLGTRRGKGHTQKHRRERRRQRKQEDTLVIRTVNTGSPYGTSCGQKESWGGMGRSWQAAQAGHSRG